MLASQPGQNVTPHEYSDRWDIGSSLQRVGALNSSIPAFEPGWPAGCWVPPDGGSATVTRAMPCPAICVLKIDDS
jgi:hypothetical protein